MENRKIPVECYDRIVGYFRRIEDANRGKKAEIAERKRYNPNRIAEDCSEYL